MGVDRAARFERAAKKSHPTETSNCPEERYELASRYLFEIDSDVWNQSLANLFY
jgi:hypothetical protein